MFWDLVSTVSNYFYQPFVFWLVPLALALVLEGVRGRRRNGSRRAP